MAWIDDIYFPKTSPCPKEEGQFYVLPQENNKRAVIFLD